MDSLNSDFTPGVLIVQSRPVDSERTPVKKRHPPSEPKTPSTDFSRIEWGKHSSRDAADRPSRSAFLTADDYSYKEVDLKDAESYEPHAKTALLPSTPNTLRCRKMQND